MPSAIPPEVTVLVRDWLSANHVLLRGDEGTVLVDTGYVKHAPFTLALLHTALGSAPLTKIVNTHCHSDHMGGNAAVARAYGCPIAIPSGEVAAIEAWDEQSLLLDYADQSAERFDVAEMLRAGSTYRWGNLDWEAIAVPGHDMNALCFFNDRHGLLISGDALWANGFGFVMPPEIDPEALPATRATLETLARLPIRTVIPGHGDPFDDIETALARAFRRLESFESNPDRLVWHALRVVLMFKLLECHRFRLTDLPGYVDRIGLYRDFNARFLQIAPTTLAETLVDDLTRSGAARRVQDNLVPGLPQAG